MINPDIINLGYRSTKKKSTFILDKKDEYEYQIVFMITIEFIMTL